jgi:hypothetical protein
MLISGYAIRAPAGCSAGCRDGRFREGDGMGGTRRDPAARIQDLKKQLLHVPREERTQAPSPRAKTVDEIKRELERRTPPKA